MKDVQRNIKHSMMSHFAENGVDRAETYKFLEKRSPLVTVANAILYLAIIGSVFLLLWGLLRGE